MILFTGFSLGILQMALCQPVTDMVRPGQKGMFVFLGKNIPTGTPTSGYKIERSEKAGNWKELSIVQTPATVEAFLSNAETFKTLFPNQPVPSQQDLRNIWQKAKATGQIDSVGGWNIPYTVRLSLGIMYFDEEVKEGIKYQYKITELNAGGFQKNVMVSTIVSIPYNPVFDKATFVESSRTYKSIFLKWMSIGKNPAGMIRIYELLPQSTLLLKGTSAIYHKKDTTWYIFQDNITFGRDRETLQYFFQPYDPFGNPGTVSEVAIVPPDEFREAYFHHMQAEKTPDRLGISISWQIEKPELLKSVDVFRSEKFDGAFKLITTLSPVMSKYSDESILADKVYYYLLRGYSAIGNNYFESGKFFCFGMNPVKPIPPYIKTAAGTSNGVELKIISSDPEAYGVRIFRNNGVDPALFEVGFTLKKDSSMILVQDTGKELSGRRFYTYAARTESTSNILSDFSDSVHVRPLLPTFPEVPSTVNAYTEDGVIKIFWENVQLRDNFIEGYLILRKEDTGDGRQSGKFEPVFEDGTVYRSNFYYDSTATEGKIYSYSVQSVDIFSGISEQAIVTSVHIPENLPVPPAGLKAVSSSEGIILEWGSAVMNDFDHYRIYRYQRGLAPVILKNVSGETLTYTDKSATTGQLFFYYLTSFDKKNRESIPSQEVGIRK